MNFSFRDVYLRMSVMGEVQIPFSTERGSVVNVWASRMHSGKRKGEKVLRVAWAESKSVIDEAVWEEPSSPLLRQLVAAIKELVEANVLEARKSGEAERLKARYNEYVLHLRLKRAYCMELDRSESRTLERNPLDMNCFTDAAISHLLEAVHQMEQARRKDETFSNTELEFVKAATRFLQNQSTVDMFSRRIEDSEL